MAAWEHHYWQNLVTPEKAIGYLQGGWHVSISSCCAEPNTLLKEIITQRERLRGLFLSATHLGSRCPYATSEVLKYLRVVTFLPNQRLAPFIKTGEVVYVPCPYSKIPYLLQEIMPPDVTILHVSPPDKHGFVSLGICTDYSLATIAKSRLVIAQVNRCMPRTFGETFLPVEKINLFVEVAEPLLELPFPPVGLPEEMIGEYVASLIPDGATLQIGIGSIPAAVLPRLAEKHNLGVHSGILSEGMIDLVNSGVINNRCKEHNPGRLVATMAVGTKRLYDFVCENPQVAFYPSSFTHSPAVAGQLKNFISINSALQVDLLGQVNAELVEGKQISGVGGMADFILAANLSPGGRAIVALPATARGGSASRIVPFFTPGTPVSASRAEVHFIVTEFGIADLRGKTPTERAKALINIAHPDFRNELEIRAKELLA